MENGSGGYDNQGADPELGVNVQDVRFNMEEEKKPTKEMSNFTIARCHIFILLLLVIAVIVLLIGLFTQGFGTWKSTSSVCETRACAQASARIAYSMDETADPCHDFYQYACGGFVKKKVIPPSSASISLWGAASEELTIEIKTLLETPSTLDHLNVVKQARVLYQSCMNETTINKRGVQPLKDLIQGKGGWAATNSTWSDANFDLEEYVARLGNLGPSIIIWGVTSNPFKNSEKMMAVFPGQLTVPNPFLYTNINFLTLYKQAIEAVAVALGADMTIAGPELAKMVDFEVELAKIASGSQLPNPEQIMTLEQADTQLPWIDLQKVLNLALAPVNIKLDKTSRIYLKDLDYMKKLGVLIGNTPNRTVASYIMFRALASTLPLLDSETRQIFGGLTSMLTGASGSSPRYETCSAIVNQVFMFTLTRLYVEKYFEEGTEDIDDMAEHIRQVFNARLADQDWLDEKSRREAKIKADAMNVIMGYPQRIMKNSELEKETGIKDLKVDDFFGNIRRSALEKLVSSLNLNKPMNRKEWLPLPPLMVNAFYSPSLNNIIFPLGILQPPFYDLRGPKVINYGAIGKVIGHEITHGFDSQGRSYDKVGDINEWMTTTSIDNFNARAKCIEDQFSDITIEQLGTKVDGRLTLGENIADAGAIKQSFQAYQNWVEENGAEKTLPGLNMTADQLFFIGFSQLYCRLITDQALLQQSQTDNHTPHKERAFGVLINSEDFARSYKCAPGTRMNPVKKCSVW